MKGSSRTIAAACFALAAFAVLYRHTAVKLVHDWATDDNYSHGFVIVPIAAYLVWQRREAIRNVRCRPSALGLLVLAGSLAMLVAGTLGAELFLTRVSLIGVIAGTVLFVAGWPALRVLGFPIACLLLMIPIPAIIFNQIAFPLQMLASRFGTAVMSAAGVPVLREGNVLILSNTTLEVAEACSGIRSLVSLLTLGIFLGYFTDRRTWARTLIAAATVPVAIVANGLRVAGTGVAAYHYGPEAAEGFIHTFSGWLVFLAAVLLLAALQQIIAGIAPAKRDVSARYLAKRAA